MPLEADLARIGLKIRKLEVGRGGSATVHQGEVLEGADQRMPIVGSFVAIKEYHETLLDDPGQVDRIRQEAQLGSEIVHPNIVRAYALVEDREGPPLLIMEWVGGPTLEQWIQEFGPSAEWHEVQSICFGLVNAVQELHSRQVFHRDIKPENVIVRKGPSPVLMDIGVAELTSDTNHTLHTSLKDFLGSTRYASPQYILGDGFTASDDVYALGATFYELFSGVRPYADVERKPVIPVRVVEAPPKVPVLRSGIPEAMTVVLQGCLNRDRRRRPTLDALTESIRSPDTAEWIGEELSRQREAADFFTVIRVMDSNSTFYADMSGHAYAVDEEYRVVRRDAPLELPSYGRQVTPERWVANAILRHVSQGVGYFQTLGEKWQEPRGGASAAMLPQGRMVETELHRDRVQKGDLVVAKRE